jgi:bacterioferritin
MSNKETISNLQKALAMELTAMHQYQLHACVLDDWGLDLLATKMRSEMQEELGHSEQFLVRILFLKGDPQVSYEKQAIDFYTQASVKASAENDIGTRQLFERIAVDEEQHMNWLELQLDLLKRMGEPAYIAKHMSIAAS